MENFSSLVLDESPPTCPRLHPNTMRVFVYDSGYDGNLDKRHVRMIQSCLRDNGTRVSKSRLEHEASDKPYATYKYVYDDTEQHGMTSVLFEAAFIPWALAGHVNDNPIRHPGTELPSRPTLPAYPDEEPYYKNDYFGHVCYWRVFLKNVTFFGHHPLNEIRILSARIYDRCKKRILS